MNKKLFFAAFIAAMTMTLGLTSCSDDDANVKEIVKANEEIAGSYSGGIYVDFAYMQKFQPEAYQTVTITANEGTGTVAVSFSNATWGTLTCENAMVKKQKDGSYSLEGTGNIAMASMQTGAVNNYQMIFTGTIVRGRLVAEFVIPSVMGGTTIKFNPEDFDEVMNAASAKDVAGSYLGGVYANFTDVKKYQPKEFQTIIITENEGGGTVSVSYSSVIWGDFNYESVTVVKNEDGSYSLAGKGECKMISQEGSDESNIYTSGFAGTITDGKLVASFSIPSLFGGVTVLFNPDDIDDVLDSMSDVDKVAGSYTGGIYANFMYMQKFQPEADQTITIAANEDGETVTVTFSNATWGEFMYRSVAVTKNEDGSYSFEGSGRCEVPYTNGVYSYATEFTGTLAGKLVATISIPEMMNGGGTEILFNPEDFDEVFNSQNNQSEE